jgi:hypothetical protein
MAPFYALIISFAIVLLLGFALEKEPETENERAAEKTAQKTTAPAAVTPSVTFSAKGSKNFPGAELTLVHGDEMETIGDNGTIPAVPLNEKYVLCAVLGDDWTGVDATRAPDSRYTCWGPFDPKSDQGVVLRVEAVE